MNYLITKLIWNDSMITLAALLLNDPSDWSDVPGFH